MEQRFSKCLISSVSITWEPVINANSHTLNRKWVGGHDLWLNTPSR